MATLASARSFSGRRFTVAELELVREVVGSCAGLSRMELAQTVCELLGWQRPSGRLKARECLEFLERLGSQGLLKLPEKRSWQPREQRPGVASRRSGGDLVQALEGTVGEFQPIVLEEVCTGAQRRLHRELVGRHHYLGHSVPFGAQLRYLIYASRPERVVVGCLQFSSPAWRMAVRDRWIGWDEVQRRKNLQRVVNNSRFLILPWVRIKNLASVALSEAARRLRADWSARYAVEPVLLETLVDRARYTGHCYRASNWLELGRTTGRGRMDREHARHGAAPKAVWVYPLVQDAVGRLRG
jgi:hypothetical protein